MLMLVTNMKKVLLFSLVALLAFTLVGCGGDDKKDHKEEPDKIVDTPTEKPTDKDDDKKDESDSLNEEDDTPSDIVKTPADEEENNEEIVSSGEYHAKISSLKASVEDDLLRLDFAITADESGEVYLTNGSFTNVGPIEIKTGTYHIHFLLNMNDKSSYTLKLKSASNQTVEFEITQDMITQAMEVQSETDES